MSRPLLARRVVALALLAARVALAAPALAQSDSAEAPCPGDGTAPPPVVVTVVPIVVESTTADYFVLYVKFDVDGTEVEQPVLVKLGEAGTTMLAENVESLPKERYRVEQYLIADPADVDGDCVDDITELNNLGSMNPVNPAAAIDISDGAMAILDQATLETYAFAGFNKLFLKYILFGMDTDRPGVYFQNTKTYGSHEDFLDVIGLTPTEVIRGEIAYDPALVAPDGRPGVYYYANEWAGNSFGVMARIYAVIAASLPLLENNLALHLPTSHLPNIQDELSLLKDSRISLLFDRNIYSGTDFLALNPGEGYGRLQILEPDERPHPRDVVLYEALPNELPRVAGLISTVPQTLLSHVNLRAIQDGVPNAFIRDIRADPALAPLLGNYVRYAVTEDGWELRVATKAEVDAHYESSRPADPQTPERDLSVTEITPLSEIRFDHWRAFGVKAANVAVLGTLGFPAGTVPDGFAIPFYFYDAFMQANGLDDAVQDLLDLLADPNVQTDFDDLDDLLDDLRDAIKDAETPPRIIDALTAMHATYPEGQSLRYRSSTNNEDLPGFNGAGLYDSKTQDPDETEEDGIDKSFKGVLASLWTFRAFTERKFHRIDHLAAAMGVLVHPNYTDELANGVAVSFDPTDPTFGGYDWYYVNTQVGEDLVTNPEAHSVPEEIKLYRGGYIVLSTSNLVEPGKLLMSDAQLYQLRDHLTVIHAHFEGLYAPAVGEPFAMEIEFKITSEDILAIKQARPWVFGDTPPPPPPPPPPGGGSGSGSSDGEQTGSAAVGYLENPGAPSFQSGIGVLSGWVCAADEVEIELNGAVQAAAYGTERVDTADICGDTDNGFGLLFNWNLLGDGEHEVVASVDGIELGRATVTVTTLGEEFVKDVAGTCTVPDFPMPGETVAVEWQESRQNFVITDGPAPTGTNRAGTAGVGYLENPGPNSFQSGVGVLSGWVCEADTVELAIGTAGRQVAGYGTERLDTQDICGDTNNGFGLLFNWNLLGDGEHTVVAYVDDVELGRATVRVTTLGTEFLRGAEGECVVADFPSSGETVTLAWQQNQQNFVVTAVE